MKRAKIRVNKNKKNNEIKVSTEYSIKNLIKIVIIITLIFALFYLITIFASKKIVKDSDSSVKSTLVEDYDNKISFAELLNRKEEEYYVLATMESKYKNIGNYSASYINLYNNYIEDYKNKENALIVYKINLDNVLNKAYISDKNNITNDLSELKVNDEALFKIKDKEIVEYYIGSKHILTGLKKINEDK